MDIYCRRKCVGQCVYLSCNGMEFFSLTIKKYDSHWQGSNYCMKESILPIASPRPVRISKGDCMKCMLGAGRTLWHPDSLYPMWLVRRRPTPAKIRGRFCGIVVKSVFVLWSKWLKTMTLPTPFQLEMAALRLDFEEDQELAANYKRYLPKW